MRSARRSILTRTAIVFIVWSSAASFAPALLAADQWIEVKSPHFTVTSDAGQSSARALAWQLEQIRSALATLWPWARLDLDKPLIVLAVKDEQAMKTIAPGFWEQKGSVHPATVWTEGRDQYYLALRTDINAVDKRNINPYISSYFSYVSLILSQSVDHRLPLWFSRGLAGVMSNTIVLDTQVMLGPPIPWEIDRLRTGTRLPVATLVKLTYASPQFRGDDGMLRVDAEAWALVHMLMFGDNGARANKFAQFASMVSKGTDPDVAFREALGAPEDLETPLANYISRSLYSYRQVDADVSVKREGFATRPLSVAESASTRALFHAAMNRPLEARAAIDEARKAVPAAPESFVAEGLLLERAEKLDEAQAAYAHAVDAGSTNSYAYYRLGQLLWRTRPDHDTLVRLNKLFVQAINLNTRNASAYADLAEVSSELGSTDALGYVRRAIALDPSSSYSHQVAARVLLRDRKYDEASAEARAAMETARTDQDRQQVQQLTQAIERGKGGSN